MAHTPYTRYGTAEELVGAVQYLISDSALFTTGAILSIDGGYTSYTV